jgi:hypothetical protein
MTTLAVIQRSLQIADDWQKKSQPLWEQRRLHSALLGYLQLAVNEHSDPASGIAWLESQKVGSLLQRRLDNGKILAAEVDAGRIPSSQDFSQIEGSGEHPVKWDFRRNSLVTYLASRYE